jgi:hypothetical protein
MQEVSCKGGEEEISSSWLELIGWLKRDEREKRVDGSSTCYRNEDKGRMSITRWKMRLRDCYLLEREMVFLKHETQSRVDIRLFLACLSEIVRILSHIQRSSNKIYSRDLLQMVMLTQQAQLRDKVFLSRISYLHSTNRPLHQ